MGTGEPWTVAARYVCRAKPALKLLDKCVVHSVSGDHSGVRASSRNSTVLDRSCRWKWFRDCRWECNSLFRGNESKTAERCSISKIHSAHPTASWRPHSCLTKKLLSCPTPLGNCLKQRSMDFLYLGISQIHERSKTALSLQEGDVMFPEVIWQWCPFLSRALTQIPWKSILWATPLSTYVPWSHTEQVVMVIHWRNWLVDTNKRGGKSK